MTLRQRIVGLVTLVTAVGLGLAFTGVSWIFNKAQRDALDTALLQVALYEAAEVPAIGYKFTNHPGPAANEVGPLPKHGVIYGGDGRVLAATALFEAHPPSLDSLRQPLAEGFDYAFEGLHLRAIMVAVPKDPAVRVLLAAPREDIDSDERNLERAMLLGFVAVLLWAVLIANAGAGLLTREYAHLAEVVRGAAMGQLDARALGTRQDATTAALARDLDIVLSSLRESLASQRRFVANAAHELRSPLTRLIGELQQALRRDREVDAYKRAIHDSLEAARSLSRLSEDLLTLARVGATEPDFGDGFPVRSLVDEAAGYVAEAASARGVTLEIAPGAEDAEVSGEPRDLVRLFRNLLENAVRHSPEGGKVQVTVAVEEQAVRVRVQDEGEGVPEADRLRVFDPFFRGAKVRSVTAGAGLGLGISREIARAHGGDVVLEARPGEQGATFTVSLRASSAPAK